MPDHAPSDDLHAISRLAVSVVVCTYRRPALLDLCLASLAGETTSAGLHEILVIDNAPQQDARPVAERWRSVFAGHGTSLRYVVEERTGVGHARNRGVALAAAPLVAFIDDDERALSGWLERLTAPFADPGVDMVAGEVDPDFGDHSRPDWLTDGLLHVFSCRWGWDSVPRFLKPGEWFGEGNCAFRKRLVDGRGFPTDLGRSGDGLMSSEGMLFTALRAAGATAYYVPGARVSHHIHPDRLDKAWVLRRMFFQGTSDYIAHRRYGLSKLPQDFNFSLGKLMALDVQALDPASLQAMSHLYYQLGYAAGSNMY
ncbi:glycosyltransferase (plasmid) [Azospirillum sp. TSH100]|nr:glycosyltransferase [Azospirillum sp. TSH100]